MKAYGRTRRDNLTCKFGCCASRHTAKKYTHGRTRPRHKQEDARAKKAARRDGRLAGDEVR